MDKRNIIELIYLVRSCKNNLDKRHNHKFDERVNEICLKYCEKHNINITHGSAYNELRHKCYYYINKNIKSIIDNGIDIYELYKNKVIEPKTIVDKLLKRR